MLWKESGAVQRSTPVAQLDTQSAATRAENQNIGFDWAYVEYTSPIGMFDVGYMDDGGWGTIFGDSSVPRGIISWAAEKGPWTAFFQILKLNDNSKSFHPLSFNNCDR
jgi:monoamine oxidase